MSMTVRLGLLFSLFLSSCAVRHPTIAENTAKPVGPKKLQGDSADEAAAFFTNKRWQGPGELPAERYLIARDHARRLPLARLAHNGSTAEANPATDWTALGPGNVGGRTRALAIDPNSPNTIFAGTATGGVWKTLDGGQNWTSLTDFLPVLSVSSLVMDPTNSQTLYLGTGETTRGAGIFKTTDGGVTWNQLTSTNNSSFYYVYSLVINPKLPNHIYAATNVGVYVSLDAGVTWKRSYPAATTASTSSCNSLALRSDQPTEILFASCNSVVSSTVVYSVYRNEDVAGTGSWSAVQTDPKMYATSLAIAPTAPGTIYALSVTNESSGPFRGALLGVFRSTQDGDSGTWTKQADTTDPNSVNANILSYPTCSYSPADHHGQSSYNLNIAVDPTDANVVFAQGIDVFRSDDGGVTWGWVNGATNHSLHSDQHTIAFDPRYDGKTNQTLYAGNDGGIFRTDNARGAAATAPQAFCGTPRTEINWTGLNNGYASTQFYHGAVLPGGQGYFGGTQDNGTPLGTDKAGVNGWTSLYGGDGGQVAVDPLDANTMFYEYVYLSMRKSKNGGMSNALSTTGITEASNNFLFINSYTMDPSDPQKMYTGGSQLWRSLDEGDHWTAASAATIPPPGYTIDTISTQVVDPNDSNHVLIGTATGGNIYRSNSALTSTGTTVWAHVQPRMGYVSRIVFDPKRLTTVYATYATFRSDSTQSQIYRSMDSGITWVPVGLTGAASLPDLPVHVLIVDPDDSTRLYIGTDTGVFLSSDSGVTWARDANPFGDAITETLQIRRDGNAKFLYAFTYGRGVWRLNLTNTPSGCTYALASGSVSVDANEQFGSVTVTTAPGCSWTARPGKTFVSLQSPASGTGSGTAYFRVSYNGSNQPRTDSFLVQDQTVSITQATDTTGSHSVHNDEVTSAKAIASLPYGDITSNTGYTSNPNDPLHSCTNSADNKTQWWTFTAASSAPVLATVTGEAYTFFGDTGLAITAYPIDNGGLGNELACTAIPPFMGAWNPGSIQFNAVAGTTYAIELSGINSGNSYIVFEVATLPVVSLTPAKVSVNAGATQQFSAGVLNTPNHAVRWSITPQVGSIDATGQYTAPVQIGSATPVNVIARSFANPAATASAAITIQPPGTSFTAAGIASAASYQAGTVAPGEMVVIYGTSLGPTALTTATLDSTGKVSTNLAGTQILFDSVPAPMVYTSAGQLSAVVPYEVSGKASTQVQIRYNGTTTPAVTIPVTDSAPGLFTANSSGQGQAAMLNQDGLVNSTQFAAPRGSVVTLFGTGEGQTTPGGVDGLLTGAVLPKPILPVSVQIGGQPATVLYAGAAPGDVEGVFQINATVPQTVTPGAVPVVVTIGAHSSPSSVTMNVLGSDGRIAEVAYNNTGADPVTINVFQPGSTTPILLGSVPGGKYLYVSSKLVGNDWGIQVNSSAIRVVSHVCGYTGTATTPYWGCTGTAAQPFPR
jgi:uncharacterized protein (TIGR03437 family)